LFEKLAENKDILKENVFKALSSIFEELWNSFIALNKDRHSSAGELLSSFEHSVLNTFHSKIPKSKENVCTVIHLS
jgi:hypothetical protein